MAANIAGRTESTVEVEGRSVFYRRSDDGLGAEPIVHDLPLVPPAHGPTPRPARHEPGTDLPGYGEIPTWDFSAEDGTKEGPGC
ncbi:hypothetical protein GCM10010488_20940 [Oerskovia jenensis]